MRTKMMWLNEFYQRFRPNQSRFKLILNKLWPILSEQKSHFYTVKLTWKRFQKKSFIILTRETFDSFKILSKQLCFSNTWRNQAAKIDLLLLKAWPLLITQQAKKSKKLKAKTQQGLVRPKRQVIERLPQE